MGAVQDDCIGVHLAPRMPASSRRGATKGKAPAKAKAAQAKAAAPAHPPKEERSGDVFNNLTKIGRRAFEITTTHEGRDIASLRKILAARFECLVGEGQHLFEPKLFELVSLVHDELQKMMQAGDNQV